MKETNKRNEKFMEHFDELTGLYNRKSFYEKTRKFLDTNRDKEYVIIYWNVQRFKVINELFGRKAGDRILMDMAEVLRELFRHQEGVYARLERDNFVFCFEAVYLEKWLAEKKVEITYEGAGVEYNFISCFGIYFVKNRSLSVAAMVDRSRLAMESVKDNYLKPYAYYDEKMRDRLVEEQELVSDAKSAIQKEQFKVYYQPICDALSGGIVGAEALVRWNHPERGLISPGVFIPIFEKTGFISVLDRYIWDKVCSMLEGRAKAGKSTVPVSINVSRVDFYNQNLCRDILEIMKNHHISSEQIKIEVTESAYSNNPQQVRDIVDELHEQQLMVLMDDFGSGYSSLNTLKDLPVDTLKIDMKFMNNLLDENSKAAIILESIVRMAKWMGLKTVAEGVENAQEMEYLRSIECDSIQGYYYYKPMPEEEFEAIINDKNNINLSRRKDKKSCGEEILNIYSGNISAEFLFQNMVGGMGVLEQTEDRLEILRVNQGYYEVMDGFSDLSRQRPIVNKQIPKVDQKLLLTACQKAKETNEIQKMQMPYVRQDGVRIWINIKIRFMGGNGMRSLYYFTVEDITDIKEAEERSYYTKYSQALFKVFDKVYRLDFDTWQAQVLYSADETEMKEGEYYYFKDFFDRFRDQIEVKGPLKCWEILSGREALDAAISQSRSGSVNMEYRVLDQTLGFEWVSSSFFKVELNEGTQVYLVCVKRI